jgi:hypothetical protein
MSLDARHSPFYMWLDNGEIRGIVRRAQALPAGQRLVLIPAAAVRRDVSLESRLVVRSRTVRFIYPERATRGDLADERWSGNGKQHYGSR